MKSNKKNDAVALVSVVREGWPSDSGRKMIAIRAFAYGLRCATSIGKNTPKNEKKATQLSL